MFYWILAVAIVAADQTVKAFIRASLPLHGVMPLLPGWFDLTYVQNTGAAFSLLQEYTWVLTLLSGAATVALAAVLAKRVLPHWTGMLAIALLLGGAAGNLVDRVAFGFVTDMFAATFVRFPVFNVADIAVTAGGILLCFHALFFTGRDKKKETVS